MTTLTKTQKPTTLFVPSTANPNPEALTRARTLLAGDSEAMTAFQLTDPMLVTEATKAFLDSRLSPEDAEACAQYLADEALEVAKDPEIRSLVTSPRTGRVIRVLRDEDLWQPKPYITKDKDGNEVLTTPPVRIRPSIEAEIVLGIHEEEREERVTASLTTRIGDALLRGEYDPRILFATKAGRTQLIAQFQDKNVKTLLDDVKGPGRVFLDLFDVEYGPVEEDFEIHNFSTRLGVQDQMTVNPGEFDPFRMVTSSFASSLVRSLAKAAVATEVTFRTDLPAPKQWIVDPSRSAQMRRLGHWNLLYADGVGQPVGLGLSSNKAGKIVIDPESLQVNGSERFDSWVVDASIRFKVVALPAELTPFTSQLPDVEPVTLVEGA